MSNYHRKVRLNPEKIKTISDLEKVISYMEDYGKKYKCKPVVLYIQNNQMGAIYSIYPEERANYFKEHPTCERVLDTYDISFYENMRKNLTNMPELTNIS